MKRPLSALLLGAVLGSTGCSKVNQELTVVFPDGMAREHTTVMAFTAFEPIIVKSDGTGVDFVSCEDIGTFPPTRIVDPDSISSFPNLGEVMKERESSTFPFDGDWAVDFKKATANGERNPWGAVMVYIEARGEVRAPQDQGGGMVSATLLAGCYCVRTAQGSLASDAKLDETVKRNCELLDQEDESAEIQKGRTVELKAVPRREFKLRECGVTQLAAPKNELLSPGPAVCLSAVRCEDAQVPDCFQCRENCGEVDDLRNAPILFTVDEPGGSSGPASQVVLTDSKGQARGAITVDDCRSPITVHAQVVGRNDPPVSFAISCVDPVGEFQCEGDIMAPSANEPVGITALPGGQGQPDAVAVLYLDGNDSLVQVIEPRTGRVLATQNYVGETARAIHGFYYQIGNGPRSGSRPMLAVATSDGQGLRLYMYDWDLATAELSNHDLRGNHPVNEVQSGVDSMNRPVFVNESCFNWACGSQEPCAAQPSCAVSEVCTSQWACDGARPCNEKRCILQNPQPAKRCTPPGTECARTEACRFGVCTPINLPQNCSMPNVQPERACTTDDECGDASFCAPGAGTRYCQLYPPPLCGCKLKVEFGTDVSITTTDIDGDLRNDLAIATSSDLPVVVYRSSQSGATGEGPGNPVYKSQGCSCGRFAQAPSAFELLNFGGVVNGAEEGPFPGSIDLVIGAPGGSFVRYATPRPSANVELSCGAPSRFGDLVPVRDVKRGRFACNPLTSPGCQAYEDIVVVAAKSLGGGSFDDPGTIRVVYGSGSDVSRTEDLFDLPGSTQELIPKAFPMRADPKDPRSAGVTDFNGDGNDDLAVLFGSSFEVHIWLGAANKGLGETNVGVLIDRCNVISEDAEETKCNPHRRFALPDVDGDGRAEVVVICDANAPNARLRWFSVAQ